MKTTKTNLTNTKMLMAGFIVFAIALCFSFNSLCFAQSVPQYINYQGTLTDSEGEEIKVPKKLEFNIYNDPNAGTKVWGPQTINNVQFVEGHFNVILGTDVSGRSVADAFGSSSSYLGIKVGNPGGNLSGVEEIKPRQQILSAPYAVTAFNGVPVGTIVAYWGTTKPPGWLLCDGKAIPSGAKYDALRNRIGSNTPNLKGRMILGLDNMGGGSEGVVNNSQADVLGGASGEEKHILAVNEMPKHSHSYMDVWYSEGHDFSNAPQVSVPGALGSQGTDNNNVGHQLSRTTGTKGENDASNNMPPYIAMSFIIKY